MPYEDSRDVGHSGPCCGLSMSDLSRVHNSAHLDHELPIGVEIDVNIVDGVERIPAIQPLTRKYIF